MPELGLTTTWNMGLPRKKKRLCILVIIGKRFQAIRTLVMEIQAYWHQRILGSLSVCLPRDPLFPHLAPLQATIDQGTWGSKSKKCMEEASPKS
uniref:Uncharacterized protein n=1 Tax=Picea sitchensis TaxID=3332 RepID=B8LNL0_PICSI|nr:unknown [Picea sitchensis]